MNQLSEITDDEFVPFLDNLGVDTYKKSFEWMLTDPDFSEVLGWLYKNLDHNNALTPREEYRYSEIDKRQKILPEADLQSSIQSIQQEYEGICLPGDKDKIIDVKLDINFQKERLQVLEKQERIIQDLISKNEAVKEEVTLDITQLHAVQQQCVEDEKTESEACLMLAEEVESITEDIIDIVTKALNLIGRTQSEKEIAKMFFTFGPFEAYCQSQALFRSHFDLYTSKMFQRKQNDGLSDEELRTVLVEAKMLEDRLSEAAYAYIESQAELAGERSKLELVSGYVEPHPSQIVARSMEAQSALGLQRRRQRIAEQQLRAAVARAAAARTGRARAAAARAVAALRQSVLTAAERLCALGGCALRVDRGARALLAGELRARAELAHFAATLRAWLRDDARAARCRRESMNRIISELAICDENLSSNDWLTSVVSTLLGAPAAGGGRAAARAVADLGAALRDLKLAVEDQRREKERQLEHFRSSVAPLHALVFDGCTKPPNVRNSAAGLFHRTRAMAAAAEKRVNEASASFTAVKSGDKQNLRKLWQWFLCEPHRLQAPASRVL